MNRRLSNPYFKRVSNDANLYGENPVTIGGIAIKILYFLILTGAGLAVHYLNLVPQDYLAATLIGSAAVSVISALLSYFVPSLTPLFGSLYCIAQGYLLGFICAGYANLYNGIIPIALGITFLVIVVMLFLYSAKIIKVGQRFKAVVSTLFLASIVLSGLVFISSFFTDAISSIVWGNSWIGIAISAASLLLASLNLAVDFDNIAMSVKNQYSKRFEWSLAFGLVMTVIMIFIRVLQLVAKIMSKTNND